MSDKRESGVGSRESSVSRRNALKVLGVLPVAAATSVAGAANAERLVAPTVAALTPPTTGAPAFFNAHEWRTLRVLVDYIIPKDEHSGSATDAKVPEYIDFLLAEKDASLANQTAMRGGLAWLDTECRHRFSKDFLTSSDAQRRAVLDDISWPRKAKPEMSYGVSFFSRVRDMTASGFFSSSMGWKDLQYMGNTFNPGYNGCPQPALDKLGVSYDLMKTRIPVQEK